MEILFLRPGKRFYSRLFDDFGEKLTLQSKRNIEYFLEAVEEKDRIDIEMLDLKATFTDFPDSIEGLQGYEVIALSNFPSKLLALHPRSQKGLTAPNRLKLVKQFVNEGGGLCMIGGRLGFQGSNSGGEWSGTPIEKVLPVKIKKKGDRVERPKGVTPTVVKYNHPILNPISADWPKLLGYNKTLLRSGSNLLLRADQHPLLSVREVQKGRTAVFASDFIPPWGSIKFTNWKHYNKFWRRLFIWLSGNKEK